MPMQAERRNRWDYGPGLWDCCFGGPWRRPSRREKTEALKDYIAELKEELQDAEERPPQLVASRDLAPIKRFSLV
jgi:hypothetical protein